MNSAPGYLFMLLISLPFAAVGDWFGWLKRQPPVQQELAKACHGIGMLALLVYAIELSGGFVDFIAALVQEGNILWIIPAGVAVWCLGWFLLYGPYAAYAIAPPYRAAMMVRGIAKIASGWALWIIGADLSDFAEFVLHLVAIWCLATGTTKLVLMLWGRRRDRAESMVAGNITRQQFDWDDGRMP